MRTLCVLLALSLLLAPAAAHAYTAEEAVIGIVLETKSITLGLDPGNRSAVLRVKKFVRTNGDNRPPSMITWSSSSAATVRVTPQEDGNAIVSVGSSGQPGSAVITVASGTGTAKCTVHVKQTVRAEAARFERKSHSVLLGANGVREMVQPVLLISPATASAGLPERALVRYKSSNKRVASVDERGVVSVHKTGTATITAQLMDGSRKKASCKYVVKPVKVSRLSLLKSSVAVGGRAMLRVEVEPEDAISPAIRFKSANSKLVRVDQSGMIVGLRAGKAVVRAFAGSARASVEVEVGMNDGAGGHQFLGIGNANYAGMMDQPASLSAAAKLGELYAGASFDGRGVESKVAYDLGARQIEQALRAFANGPTLNEHSVSVFYYVGYAADSGQPGGDSGLLGTDGVGVSIGRVRELLDRVPGRVVVILDCDMAGRFIDGKFAGSVQKAFAPRGLTDSKLKDKYKILVSCGSGERAYVESEGDASRWLFSGALIDGLGGSCPADGNADGIVSLAESERYVADAVSAKLAQYGYAQQTRAWPVYDNSAIYSKN